MGRRERQRARMFDVQVEAVNAMKDDGVYGEGEEIAIHVVFSHAMDVLGTPTISLNSGGVAQFTMGGHKQVTNSLAEATQGISLLEQVRSGVPVDPVSQNIGVKGAASPWSASVVVLLPSFGLLSLLFVGDGC